MSDPARFWSRVAPPDANGCRAWLRGVDDQGIGRLHWIDRQISAHRLAYGLAWGRLVPRDIQVIRECGNRLCCTPQHMRLMAHRVVDQRYVPRNKGRRGSANPNSVLTEDAVAVIKRRLRDGESSTQISREYGVHQSAIRAIGYGITWKHVP